MVNVWDEGAAAWGVNKTEDWGAAAWGVEADINDKGVKAADQSESKSSTTSTWDGGAWDSTTVTWENGETESKNTESKNTESKNTVTQGESKDSKSSWDDERPWDETTWDESTWEDKGTGNGKVTWNYTDDKPTGDDEHTDNDKATGDGTEGATVTSWNDNEDAKPTSWNDSDGSTSWKDGSWNASDDASWKASDDASWNNTEGSKQVNNTASSKNNNNNNVNLNSDSPRKSSPGFPTKTIFHERGILTALNFLIQNRGMRIEEETKQGRGSFTHYISSSYTIKSVTSRISGMGYASSKKQARNAAIQEFLEKASRIGHESDDEKFNGSAASSSAAPLLTEVMKQELCLVVLKSLVLQYSTGISAKTLKECQLPDLSFEIQFGDGLSSRGRTRIDAYDNLIRDLQKSGAVAGGGDGNNYSGNKQVVPSSSNSSSNLKTLT
jgi:hypothetical protein